METPACQLFLQSEPSVQMSRRLMSAPEIAQLKGGSMNSPLTKRRRAKNSPLHREVMPEDREGMGLGKHHGGSDSGASSGPQPLPPSQRGHIHRPAHPPSALRLSRRGRSWVAGLLLPAVPFRHSRHSLKLPRTPTVTMRSPLPPLLPSPPSHH